VTISGACSIDTRALIVTCAVAGGQLNDHLTNQSSIDSD